MLMFQNEGEIDRRAITTFGVNVKENKNPIGIFGTGLKYAIAVILRLGGRITIYSGSNTLKFGTRDEIIRRKTFNTITINGRRTNWTTELGQKWEAWEALRELYINTMDEGGKIWSENDFRAIGHSRRQVKFNQQNQTNIVVDCADVEKAWKQKGRYFIDPEIKRLAKSSTMEVLPGANLNLFYKGIRIAPLMKPTLYTYNLTRDIELTEDRSMRSWWMASAYIAQGIMGLSDRHYLNKILTAPSNTHEHDLTYGESYDCSKEFLEAAQHLLRHKQPCNNSLFVCCLAKVQDVFNTETEINAVEASGLERAIRFCMSLGYKVDDYKIRVVPSLGSGVLGMAKRDGNEIIIAKETLRLGVKQVTITLLEEYFHLEHGFDDCSRRMQDYLMTELITLGERINKIAL